MTRNAVVIIPSYEPDQLLINTVTELKKEGFPILVVNDGSSSQYNDIFNSVMNDVEYLSYAKNKGKGYALKYAFSHIRELFPDAKYLITVDGDGQHALEDVVRVYDELNKNNVLVFGVRRFSRDVPFRSRFGNQFSKLTRTLLTKTYIADDQCGLRGFPISYINELIKIKGNRYEYEMNQIVRFQLKQYPIITLPIKTVYLDNNSRSHFSPFKDTVRIQGIILSHSFGSLIWTALTIFFLILFNNLNIFRTVFQNIICTSLLTFGIYLLLMTIFSSTSKFFRRTIKEAMFSAIRTLITYYLIISVVKFFPHLFNVISPIAVLTSCSFNVFFAWALRKVFKTF